jgi:hypothetical protein
MCGISANMVGRIANQLGLKIEEYGMFLLSQSPHSLKQVTAFHYRRKAADRIREFLDAVKKAPIEDVPKEFNLDAAYL